MSTFSPLDLLSMSDKEQDILRCISKQSDLTLPEIVEATQIPTAELEELLDQLIHESRVVEQLKDNKRTFSVRFSKSHRRIRNLPDEIVNLYDQSSDERLSEAPLISQLSSTERQHLLDSGMKRSVVPDEVIVWQGKSFEYVGLVRSGLLKQTRLQSGQSAGHTAGYTRHLQWFGLNEVLNNTTSLQTYTAVTDSELFVWPVEQFLDFIKHNAQFSFALSQWLGQELYACQSQKVRGLGKLWAVDSVHRGAGSTTLALNLAWLIAQNSNGREYRTVLCNLTQDDDVLRRRLNIDREGVNSHVLGQNRIYQLGGVDVLLNTTRSDYPPQVQVDILLTNLRSVYDYIICDTGISTEDELVMRLRGQADTLLTVTDDVDTVDEGQKRWSRLQPFTHLAQKRLLVLNRVNDLEQAKIPAAFHVTLPSDRAGLQKARQKRLPLVQADPGTALSQALAEVHRRLSLTHSIGIFIPSTLDVNQEIDNTPQVQSALSFLGKVFGGATSSEAEGVWRSEESGLVTEQVTIVRTFVSERSLQKHLDDVIEFATNLKVEMKQEAVAIDVDNQLVLV